MKISKDFQKSMTINSVHISAMNNKVNEVATNRNNTMFNLINLTLLKMNEILEESRSDEDQQFNIHLKEIIEIVEQFNAMFDELESFVSNTNTIFRRITSNDEY